MKRFLSTTAVLLTMTGVDMGNLRMELEKIISYTGDRDVVTGEDIQQVCTTQTQNKIFDMGHNKP